MVDNRTGRARVAGRPERVSALHYRRRSVLIARSQADLPDLSNPLILARIPGDFVNMFRITVNNLSVELLLTGEPPSGILDA